MKKNNNYKVKSRIWIEGSSGTFLAEGRIELLKKIMKNGSISRAAREMSMSYSKAWEMIDNLNKEADYPVVIKATGGKDGGGTIITAYGQRAITGFEKLNKKCQDFLEKELQKIEI